MNDSYLSLLLLTLLGGAFILFTCESKTENVIPLESNWQSAISFQTVPEGLTSISAESCGVCHQNHYTEWLESTHSKAWTDAQFQAEINKQNSPYLCLNCHIPLENQQELFIHGLYDGDIYRPKTSPNKHFDKRLQLEGITCAVCHVRNGYIIGPTGSEKAPHPTKKDLNQLSVELCISCHNANAKVTKELVCSFETADEWKKGPYYGQKNCIVCHMPELVREIAPGAGKRKSRFHGFPGSGIPKSPDHHPERLEGLLIKTSGNAKSIAAEQAFSYEVILTNAFAGHNIPTGDPERFLEVIFELKNEANESVAIQRDTIGEKWKWYPVAIKISDNNLKPKESRQFSFDYWLKEPGTYTFSVVVLKHRLGSKSAHYNGLDENYPLFIELFRETKILEIR